MLRQRQHRPARLDRRARADAAGGFIALVQVHRVLATPPFGGDRLRRRAGHVPTARGLDQRLRLRGRRVRSTSTRAARCRAVQVTVTPDTDLLNFQTVTVAGIGLHRPTGGVQLVQCKTDATSYEDCSPGASPTSRRSAPRGTFSTPDHRAPHPAPRRAVTSTARARPARCSLVSRVVRARPGRRAAPIGFDASVPPPCRPRSRSHPTPTSCRASRSPSPARTSRPNSFVGLSECLTAPRPTRVLPVRRRRQSHTDATGAFTTTFTVRRGVPDFASYPPERRRLRECAADSARSPRSSFDGEDRASQAIDFDPSVPVAVPDVDRRPAVRPARPRGGERAQLRASRRGERVVVSQCDADAPTYRVSRASTGGRRSTPSPPTPTVRSTRRCGSTACCHVLGRRRHHRRTPVNCADAVGACVHPRCSRSTTRWS